MDIVISILLVIFGLIGGFVFTTIFNSLRENNANKKVEIDNIVNIFKLK